MAVLTSLANNATKASRLSSLKYRLYLVALQDVNLASWGTPIQATLSDVPLNSGSFFTYLDAKSSSVVPATAAGESPLTGKLTVDAVLEGLTKENLAWVYKHAGERVILVWERCSDGQKFVGGNPCSGGLVLKYTSIGAQDGGEVGIALQFEGDECPEPFYFYSGDVKTAEDVASE